MATTPQNNLVRLVGAKKTLSHPVDASGSNDFNGGDMLALDAGVLKPLTDALADKSVGVAQDNAYLDLTGDKQYAPQATVVIGAIHSMKTTIADTLTHMLPVYCGADAQTVVVADPGSGEIVGYAVMRASITSITGAAGVNVDVLIVPKLPTPSIA